MNAKPKDIDRLIEESNSRERELLEQFDAVSALFGELLLQLKQRLRQINDPAQLLGYLEILRAINDLFDTFDGHAFNDLERSSKRAEDIRALVATENDPGIKARLLEVLSRINNQVTSLTDRVPRMKKARQRRVEELDSLTASINELMSTLETPAE